MNKAQLRQLIAENRLDDVLRLLLDQTLQTHLHQSVLLLSSRHAEFKNRQLLGLDSSQELDSKRNNIVHSLLQVIDGLPENAGASSSPPPAQPPAAPAYPAPGDGSNSSDHTSVTFDNDVSRHPKMTFWFSVAAFAVLLTISLLMPGWAQQNNALFKTLLALAAAGVAATLPGFLNFEVQNFIKAGGALAAFGLVFFVSPAKESTPAIFTVQLRSNSPSTVYPPLKIEKLEIWNQNDWLQAQFPKDGVADFKNFSPDIIGKKVAVRYSAPHFRLSSDSLFIVLPAGVLEFVPNGQLEVIAGKLLNVKGTAFIKGAVIEVEGIRDTTDNEGNFYMKIPPYAQKTEYTLQISVAGKPVPPRTVHPASDIEIRL